MKGILLDRIEDMHEHISLLPTQPLPHRKRGEHEPSLPKETVKRKHLVSETESAILSNRGFEHQFDPNFVDFGQEVTVDESIVKMEKSEILIDQSGGRYEIQQALGEGGMGSVYQVKDLKNGMEKAVKFIKSDRRDKAMIVDRFEREIHVMAMLQDPFILPALDVIQVKKDGVEVTGLVMAYVEGPNLDEEIENEKKIESSRAILLTAQIVFALETLREVGIVHRDIKPANILLQKISTGEEFVQLGDFGIVGFAFASEAESVGKPRDAMAVSEDVLTVTGEFVGTPGFSSPEAVMGKGTDHRNDLYALGVTVYRMLTGEYPYSGDTLKEIVNNQLSQIPPSFKDLGCSNIPEWLEHLVMNLLEPDPEDRFQTAKEVFQALKEGVEQDYPELLTTIPFVWDYKRTSSYDTSIQRAA